MITATVVLGMLSFLVALGALAERLSRPPQIEYVLVRSASADVSLEHVRQMRKRVEDWRGQGRCSANLSADEALILLDLAEQYVVDRDRD